MEIADLNKFLVIARYNNLQKAANELDITPSALSKSLKRLETTLDLLLFDRVGKTLRLNDQGRLLQPSAAQMIALADNTRAQLNNKSGASGHLTCRIAAPAILQYRWASVISRVMSDNVDSTLIFETAFEAEALNKLKQGEVHLALVTNTMLTHIPAGIDYIDLGALRMQVAAGRTHLLAKNTMNNTAKVTTKALLAHAFATPHISPFCGETRGLGCDGWQDQLLGRKVGWVVNDYAVLSQLVKSGQAIAYLPDFLLREWQLIRLDVVDYPHQCSENVLLLFQAKGHDWVHKLVNGMCD